MLKEIFDAIYNCPLNPTIVYQMGKVGSRTIEASLLYNTHFARHFYSVKEIEASKNYWLRAHKSISSLTFISGVIAMSRFPGEEAIFCRQEDRHVAEPRSSR